MKADLTRKSFDPLKHFSRVLMQQGRVQLDADWNEQSAIFSHALRTFVVDSWGPLYNPNGGLVPITLEQSPNPTTTDFGLQWGTLYVDGILCELEATPVPILQWPPNNKQTIQVAYWTVDGQEFQKGQFVRISDEGTNPVGQPIIAQITDVSYSNRRLTLDTDVSSLSKAVVGRVRRITTYSTQPDLPSPIALKPGNYHVYLDVWERLITSLEDGSIREVALNGADTAARTRVVWQVNVIPTQQTVCLTSEGIATQLQPWSRGLVRARTQPPQVATDPCTISPTSRYRGPENQLYRVEVHTGGKITDTPPPTFKWSRENGAVVFPIVKLAQGGAPNTTVVTVGSLGRDDRFGLAVGDWVEALDDTNALNSNPNNPDSPGFPGSPGIPGTLMQVQGIDPTNLQITLLGSGAKVDLTRHPLLRRWDHKAGDPTQGGVTLGPDHGVLIPPDPTGSQVPTWLDLEDGLQVLFDEVSNATFRTGDYWLIPARVATGDVIWPQETGQDAQGNEITAPAAKLPDGITHHYAPLAIVTIKDGVMPAIQFCPGDFTRRR